MRALFALGSIFVATLAAMVLASCLGATEILLDIHTNVPCTGKASWQGVAIYTGDPGLDVETKAPATTTLSCDASGNIGTLAIVPSGAKDGAIGIRVVAGIARAPEDCADNDYEGCIVARRALNFIPHQTLDLRVDLTSDCLNEACDALHSCTNGACDDARVTETSSSDSDASTVSGPVRCGDNGVTCPTTGELCCLEASFAVDPGGMFVDGGTKGQCMIPKDCPSTSIVVACDDSSECAGQTDDAGAPYVCCMNSVRAPNSGPYEVVTGLQCLPQANCKVPTGDISWWDACQDRAPCGDAACVPAVGAGAPLLPGYWYCQIPTPTP